MVECKIVNLEVVGSSPTPGAFSYAGLAQLDQSD